MKSTLVATSTESKVILPPSIVAPSVDVKAYTALTSSNTPPTVGNVIVSPESTSGSSADAILLNSYSIFCAFVLVNGVAKYNAPFH